MPHIKKPTAVTKFKWSGPYDNGDRWCCDHPDLQGLDVREVKDGPDGSVYWTISCRGNYVGEIADSLSYMQFDDRDHLAYVVLCLVRAHKKAVAAVPIPADLHEMLQRHMRMLNDQVQTLRSLGQSNRIQRHELLVTARLLKVDLSTDETDLSAQVQELNALKFRYKGKDRLFVDEILYDVLGKDDARTVRAYINRIIRFNDPSAEEI